MHDFILLTGSRHHLESCFRQLKKAFNCQFDPIFFTTQQQPQGERFCIAFDIKPNSSTAVNANSRVYSHNGIAAFGSIQPQSSSTTSYNHASLGDQPATSRSAIHAAYQRWGSNMAHNLQGQFNYCLLDQNTGVLQGALSPFNGSQLFLFNWQGITGVTTNASILKQIPGFKLTAEKSSLACWLAGQPDPHAPMFEELTSIPPGYCFVISNGQVELRKFWDINPSKKIRFEQIEDYQQQFYSLLQSGIGRDIGSYEGCVFSQMSGGMDSTSVSYLASKICKENNIAFHTISHQYPNKANCDETDLIRLMVSRIKPAEAHFIDINKLNRSLCFAERYPTNFNNPGIVSAPQYIEELKLLSKHGGSTLFTGNGGDEVCWGHSSVYTSRLMRADLKVIPEVFNSCKELNEPFSRTAYRLFLKPFLPDFLLKTANLLRGIQPQSSWPFWLTPTAVQLASESVNNNAYFSNPYSKRLNPANYARYQSLHRTSTYNSLRSYQNLAKDHDIKVFHPFFDPKVIEFSFAVPEKLLIQGKYPKWLLRKTMNGHLPDEICWKQAKVVFDQHFANLVRQNADELTALLAHEGLQDIGLIDNRRVLSTFNEILTNPNKHLNVDLLYVILTQSWYQKHCL